MKKSKILIWSIIIIVVIIASIFIKGNNYKKDVQEKEQIVLTAWKAIEEQSNKEEISLDDKYNAIEEYNNAVKEYNITVRQSPIYAKKLGYKEKDYFVAESKEVPKVEF